MSGQQTLFGPRDGDLVRCSCGSVYPFGQVQHRCTPASVWSRCRCGRDFDPRKTGGLICAACMANEGGLAPIAPERVVRA